MSVARFNSWWNAMNGANPDAPTRTEILRLMTPTITARAAQDGRTFASLTNDQRAHYFLVVVREHLRHWVRGLAETDVAPTVQTAVNNAGALVSGDSVP